MIPNEVTTVPETAPAPVTEEQLERQLTRALAGALIAVGAVLLYVGVEMRGGVR